MASAPSGGNYDVLATIVVQRLAVEVAVESLDLENPRDIPAAAMVAPMRGAISRAHGRLANRPDPLRPRTLSLPSARAEGRALCETLRPVDGRRESRQRRRPDDAVVGEA
jgi:hypothetical protein